MGQQTIETPGDGPFCTTETAAKWLSVHEDTFDALVAEEAWMNPVRIRRKKMWRTLDVALLAYLISRRAESSANDGGEPPAKKT